jgi:hypothetical protein
LINQRRYLSGLHCEHFPAPHSIRSFFRGFFRISMRGGFRSAAKCPFVASAPPKFAFAPAHPLRFASAKK